VTEQRKGLIRQALSEFSEDGCASMAAALAYATVLSMPPLLVIIVTIAGWFFGRQAAEGRLVGELAGLVGPDTAEQLRQALHAQASSTGRTGSIVAGAIGIGTLVIGASAVFGQLQSALNQAWDIEPDPRQSGVGAWVRLVVKRLLSFSMVLVTGFLLLVSMAATAALGALGEQLASKLGVLGRPAMWAIDLGLTLLVVTFLFAALYKVLPDAKVRWREVGFGALVTGVLFLVGKALIGLYVGRARVGSVYGAAGALVVLMVWVYYASVIFLLGAEVTQVWARRHGGGITPAPGARREADAPAGPA
jgi:membrane protein